MPVPPVVTTTSYAGATASRRAAPTSAPSGTTCGPSTAKPHGQPFGDQRPPLVGVDAGRGPVRRRHHERRCVARSRLPLISVALCVAPPRPSAPAVLGLDPHVSTTAARSTAFTMSITASAGHRHGGQRLHLDAGAVGRADRGRDVDAVVDHLEVDLDAVIAIGWQSGTRSGVRFAAMMPAIRATAERVALGHRRSPPRSSATTSAETRTRPARASPSAL